jgi:hypothetical protein
MGNALVVSVLYLLVAVSLTIWLAGTLYRNGLQLLREREGQHPALAEATSRLLVIGFALFTLGFAFLLLRVEDQMSNVEALQFLIRRLGILLVSLGLIHLVNTLIFLRFRRGRAEVETRPAVRGQQRRRGTSDGPPSEQARLRE